MNTMNKKVMIDVGAAKGTESINWDGIVYAFEPCKTNFNKLKNITRPDYYTFNMAIDSKNGTRMFNEANYTNSSSLLRFTNDVVKWKNPPSFKKLLQTIKNYPVQTKRLDTFLDEINHKGPIDYLKIDTQGHDYIVLQSLGSYIYDVKLIKCEIQITKNFDLYENPSRLDELEWYMSECGFELVDKQDWSQMQELELIYKNVSFN